MSFSTCVQPITPHCTQSPTLAIHVGMVVVRSWHRSDDYGGKQHVGTLRFREGAATREALCSGEAKGVGRHLNKGGKIQQGTRCGG